MVANKVFRVCGLIGFCGVLAWASGCEDKPAGPGAAPAPAAATDPNAPVAATVKDGVQVVTITVTDRGYSPRAVELKAGVPAKLVFDQQTREACVAQVHVPTYKVPVTDLPFGKQTEIAFTPTEPGTFKWLCGMDMMKGTIVVKGG